MAIGGITAADIDPLIATGVSGVAPSGSLVGAGDTTAETAKVISLLHEAIAKRLNQ